MTSGGDLCHVGTSKLICEANRWIVSCVMRFLRFFRSEQTMILHLCGSGEYTTVLCFSIRGGMPGSLPYLALGVWRVSWNSI